MREMKEKGKWEDEIKFRQKDERYAEEIKTVLDSRKTKLERERELKKTALDMLEICKSSSLTVTEFYHVIRILAGYAKDTAIIGDQRDI